MRRNFWSRWGYSRKAQGEQVEERHAKDFDTLTAPLRLLVKWGQSDYNPIDLSVRLCKKAFGVDEPEYVDREAAERDARRLAEATALANKPRAPGLMEEVGAPSETDEAAEISDDEIQAAVRLLGGREEAPVRASVLEPAGFDSEAVLSAEQPDSSAETSAVERDDDARFDSAISETSAVAELQSAEATIPVYDTVRFFESARTTNSLFESNAEILSPSSGDAIYKAEELFGNMIESGDAL